MATLDSALALPVIEAGLNNYEQIVVMMLFMFECTFFLQKGCVRLAQLHDCVGKLT